MPSNGKVAGLSGDQDSSGADEIWPQVLEKAWATYEEAGMKALLDLRL